MTTIRENSPKRITRNLSRREYLRLGSRSNRFKLKGKAFSGQIRATNAKQSGLLKERMMARVG